MVRAEYLPMLFSPELKEREKSTSTTMNTGQWATVWVSLHHVKFFDLNRRFYFEPLIKSNQITSNFSITALLSLLRHWSSPGGCSWVWPCPGPAALPGAWCCDVSFLQRLLSSSTEWWWQEGHSVFVWTPSAHATWDTWDKWPQYRTGENMLIHQNLMYSTARVDQVFILLLCTWANG